MAQQPWVVNVIWNGGYICDEKDPIATILQLQIVLFVAL
jgi:hypothetical protein